MPFELSNTFLWKFFMVFLDNILICSESIKEHTDCINKYLKKLQETDLHVNNVKCIYSKENIDYYGHSISYEGFSRYRNKLNFHFLMAPDNMHCVYKYMILK